MTEEQLDEALREYVRREVHVDFRDWTTAIMRLPRSVRVYHLSWLLEAEVCNGGFIHFFLNFWGRLGDEGARLLASSTALGRLAELDLGANWIGSEGARALAASSLARLERLKLDQNEIGDEGARALVTSAALARLVSLDLEDNGVSDEAQAELALASRVAVRW